MQKHGLLSILFFLFFSILAVATPERARADDAAVVEAKARFKEGVVLADAGKHEEARLKFEQAAAVLRAPAVLFNLARSEQLTSHEIEAIEHYRQFLALGATDPSITDAQRTQAKTWITELVPNVGQIEVVVPAGSHVSIDGRALDDLPKEPVPVRPGRHTVEAAARGRIKSVIVECARGTIVTAKIEIDDAPEGSQPPPTTTEPPPDPDAQSRSKTKWIVSGALAGAGLVAVGIGLGLGLSSQSSKTDSETIRSQNPGLCANPPLPQCADYDAKRSSAESASTASTVAYIAGGALVASAVVAFVVWPKERRERDAKARATRVSIGSIAPLMGPSTYGAALGGRF